MFHVFHHGSTKRSCVFKDKVILQWRCPKNEDDPGNEDATKYEDNLKMKMTLKMKTTPLIYDDPKKEANPKIEKDAKIWRGPQKLWWLERWGHQNNEDDHIQIHRDLDILTRAALCAAVVKEYNFLVGKSAFRQQYHHCNLTKQPKCVDYASPKQTISFTLLGKMLEGIVMGLYIEGSKESPP